MKAVKTLFAASAIALSLSSCSDSDDNSPVQEPAVTVTITSSIPANVADENIISRGDMKLSFTELNTGRKTDFDISPDASAPQISLPVGVYDYAGTYDYTVSLDGVTKEKMLRCIGNSVTITGDMSLRLDWFNASTSTEGFVIAEIYAAGSPNATGKGSLKDTYIRIFNNSDETLYADGLGIVESDFVNSRKNDNRIITPANDRNINFTAGVVWTIPGNGRDVPVEPGKSIVICDQAIDWSEQVAGALDLRGADFEWYDDHKLDTDNPSVPNLEKWFSYSATIWVMSNQCNRSYAIVRFPAGMTVGTYIAGYNGAYDYESATTGIEMHKEKAMLIPNTWILDGVNLGDAENFVHGALGVAVDSSFGCISDKGADPARFGKAFIRKTMMKLADRDMLQDTDNSADDFTVGRPTLAK